MRDAYTYRQTIGIVSDNNRYRFEKRRFERFHQKSRLFSSKESALNKKHPLKGWMKTIGGMGKMSYKFIKI
nr:MAG TPA: hypothetical protein [Caudoviricetes sp.]